MISFFCNRFIVCPDRDRESFTENRVVILKLFRLSIRCADSSLPLRESVGFVKESFNFLEFSLAGRRSASSDCVGGGFYRLRVRDDRYRLIQLNQRIEAQCFRKQLSLRMIGKLLLFVPYSFFDMAAALLSYRPGGYGLRFDSRMPRLRSLRFSECYALLE